MTKSKTVLLWGGDDIFSVTLENILTTRPDWDVVSISNKDGLAALETALETTHSEVVVLRPERQTDPATFSINLLHDHPGLRVITVCLDENSLEVYYKQKICVNDAADLLSALEA